MSDLGGNQSLICAHCGSACEQGARFCPFCGSPLGTESHGEDVLVGKTVAGLNLEERIGADGFGRLFRGRTAQGHEVRVRVFHRHWRRKRRFFEEIRKVVEPWIGWQHPHAWPVLDLLEDKDQRVLLLVEQAWEARGLSELVAQHGSLPLSRVKALGQQACDVLQAAHTDGRAHGAVLPSCVHFGMNEEGAMVARLDSFGLARLAYDTAPRLWNEGTDVAGALYVSPEASIGRVATPADDLFSLAAVLFYALAGEPPLPFGSTLAVERLLRDGQAPMACERLIPQYGQVMSVLAKALAVEPSERFASAKDFSDAWLRAFSTEGGQPVQADLRKPAGSVLVGREDALSVLLDVAESPVAYGTASNGKPRGGVVVLSGGAGIGKTALLRSLASALEGSALSVFRVEGRCDSFVSLGPFVHMARELLASYPGSETDQVQMVQTQLFERFNLEADDAMRLLDLVTEREPSLRLDPASLRQEQVVALRSFVGRLLADRPAVLLVDDFDVMDPASRRLVRDLAGAAATMPFSIIVACRLDPWPEWRPRHVRRVELGRLSNELAKRFLRTALRDEEWDAGEQEEQLLAWAKGNPLKLATFVNAARSSSGASLEVSLQGISASSSSVGELQFRSLLQSSLQALEPNVRDAIVKCAVAGSRVPLALASVWTGHSFGRPELCRMFRSYGWARCSDAYLFFANEGIRELLASLLPASERKQVHREVADWYAGQVPRGACVQQVARHLDLAGESRKAAEAFEQRAVALCAMREFAVGAQLFEMARHRWEQLGDRDEATRCFYQQLAALADDGDAARISFLLPSLPESDQPEHRVIRARAMAAMAVAEGHLSSAIAGLQRTVEAGHDGVASSVFHDLLVDYSVDLLKSGALGQAAKAASDALDLALENAQSDGIDVLVSGDRIARDANRLADILERQGKAELARAMLMAAYEKTSKLDDPSSSGRILAVLGHLAAREGEYERALEQASRALTATTQAGNRFASARILLNIGMYHLHLEHLREAYQAFQDAARLSRTVGWSRGVRLATQALRQLVP